MDALFPYMLLVVGFFALIKGADFFVEGSASIAKKLRIPDIIVGLTIVAMGTSAPELAVSTTAALQGSSELAIGNVVGSNIFNILFILGFSALFTPLVVDKVMLKRDIPFALLAAILLPVMALIGKNSMGVIAGVLLMLLFAAYIAITVRAALKYRKEYPAQLPSGEIASEQESSTWMHSILFTLGGIVLIVCGAEASVQAATAIATAWGISETVIGLTVVAVGTSLPELVTSIVAARKGNNEIALGNVVGSNIFNILLILGLSITICPITVDPLTFIDQLVLIGVTLYLAVTAFTGRRISRGEGLSYLAIYVGYTAYLFIR